MENEQIADLHRAWIAALKTLVDALDTYDLHAERIGYELEQQEWDALAKAVEDVRDTRWAFLNSL